MQNIQSIPLKTKELKVYVAIADYVGMPRVRQWPRYGYAIGVRQRFPNPKIFLGIGRTGEV